MGNEAEDGLLYLRDVADIEPPRDRYALCGEHPGGEPNARGSLTAAAVPSMRSLCPSELERILRSSKRVAHSCIPLQVRERGHLPARPTAFVGWAGR